MKTVSGIAVAAAAGLFATNAMAADLGYGGNCCADLEERVAELEATTARKGNRKVSLTVYGRITQGILWHDDKEGYRKGKATIRDDNGSPTMLGFRGEAQIRPDLTAGYQFEFGVSGDKGTKGNDFFSLRHNFVYLDSSRLGRVTLGHTHQITDGLYEINLANTVIVPGNLNEEKDVFHSHLTNPWQIAFDGDRKQGIYYRSPTLAGFVLSAGYSHDSGANDWENTSNNNDYWEVALRYAGEFNGVRLAAGVGYRHENDNTSPYIDHSLDKDTWLGSASVMHMPTGLFVSGGLAQTKTDRGIYTDAKRDGFWVMAGIERNFFGPGTTTLYGEYSETNLNWVSKAALDAGDGTFWGLGVVQAIDAAATDLYLKYRNVETDFGGGDKEDANVFISGMRIRF